MKQLIVTIFLILAAELSYSQTEINVDSASNHEGEIVKICTMIYGGKFLESSKSQLTFLDAGAAYPNQKLTVLIWGNKRSNFKKAPEVFYKDKNVCIVGKIEIYKGKSEIIANSEDQITIQ